MTTKLASTIGVLDRRNRLAAAEAESGRPDWRAFEFKNLPEDGPYWFILECPEYDECGPTGEKTRRILLGNLEGAILRWRMPYIYAIDRTNDLDMADDEIPVAYAEIKKPPMPDSVPDA